MFDWFDMVLNVILCCQWQVVEICHDAFVKIGIIANFQIGIFSGGLAAVIYTDTLQFFVMIAGAVVLAVLSESLL